MTNLIVVLCAFCDRFGDGIMEAHLRAALAYIAGRLVSGKNACAVYDHSRSQRIMMGGEANSRVIAIYDHAQGCHISGNGSGSQYSLFHHGERRPISLTLQGSSFSGHAYGRSTRFRGTVEGNFISVVEDGSARPFGYSLVESLEPPWSAPKDETGIDLDQTDPGLQPD